MVLFLLLERNSDILLHFPVVFDCQAQIPQIPFLFLLHTNHSIHWTCLRVLSIFQVHLLLWVCFRKIHNIYNDHTSFVSVSKTSLRWSKSLSLSFDSRSCVVLGELLLTLFREYYMKGYNGICKKKKKKV